MVGARHRGSGKKARSRATERADQPTEEDADVEDATATFDQGPVFDKDENKRPGERAREERWYEVVERKLSALPRTEGKDRRTWAGVFDRRTLMTLYKFISNEVIDSMDYPVSTGKEADVFRATTPEGTFICVKIFRTSVSSFHDILQYIQGDPRFQGIKKERHGFVQAWTQKEYRNLGRAIDVGVHVPQPISILSNVLLMEFIGDEAGNAAPLIKDVLLEDPEEVATAILDDYHLLLTQARLVHADCSEYNILWDGKEPIMIDVGQAVLLEHPMAGEFFARDVANLERWFRKIGAPEAADRVERHILGENEHFEDLL